MRRKTLFLIALTLLFLTFFAPVVFAQVEIRVRVMEASNVGSGIDSSLKDLHGQLGSLFNFSSYRLLKDENISLSPDRAVSLPLDPGRSLELTLIGLRKKLAEVRVKISREGREVLTTLVRLAPGRSVSIGGPKRGEASIIIALSRP
jgi:hypothetical protein